MAESASADTRAGWGARAMLPALFFLSGVAALVYQIVWTKELSLVFGVTIYATSAVVTTFMAGLALGSLYFGRVVDRWRRPIVLFALLEAGIAAFAVAFPLLRAGIEAIYVGFYGPFGDSHYVMTLIRFVLSFAILIVPTFLMGGTLPVITRAMVTARNRLGRNVAGLYAANNIGAFLGCLAAGYFLLEMLGPLGSLWLAGGLNVAVALGSLALIRALPEAPEIRPQTADQSERVPLTMPVRVALWVFGLEGITSLVYQMGWLRILIFFVRMDIFGVTAIVATFLAGLSLGAYVSRRWVDRLKSPLHALGMIELGIGITALATIPLLPYMLGLHQYLLATKDRGLPLPLAFGLSDFAVTFAVILIPTAFMGATLPVVSRIYVDELRGLGRKMGVLGCLDTLGSIVGAFLGGFVLIPLIGTQQTIIATAVCNMGLAAWVFWTCRATAKEKRPWVGLAASVAMLAAAAFLLPLDPIPLINHSHVIKGKPVYRLVQYEEDEGASSSVVQQIGFGRYLYVNDHPVAGDFPHDRASHELVLHIPLLLHPDPERVVVIGFGIGLSVHASLTHGVDVDVVELNRSVLEVNPSFESVRKSFEERTGYPSVLDHPDVKVRLEDGRNFALGTDEKYDVIHVGGFHPVITSGAAGFYSLDFYQDCQRLLTPNGYFSQWLPIHDIPHEDFKTILLSFRRGFPYAYIWHKQTSDYCMLLGSLKPLRIDFANFERRAGQGRIREHLSRCNVQNAFDLLDSFLMDGDTIERICGHVPLQTDRHPLIEYHKFRGRDADTRRNLKMLAEARHRVLPYLYNVPEERRESVAQTLERWFEATNYLLLAQYTGIALERMTPEVFLASFERADAAYRRAIALNPEDVNAKFLYRRAIARFEVGVSAFYYDMGNVQQALVHARRAAEIGPDTLWGAMARFLLESGEGLRFAPH